jgi:ATP/maltotriose-dependent transcriptional regulator MalT
LEGYRGSFGEAREGITAARALLFDLSGELWWAGTSMLEGEIELTAGDPQSAYDALADGHRALSGHAETGYLATVVGLRAVAALRLGRDDEAIELAEETGRLAQKDDFEPHSRAGLVRAIIEARRGHLEEAEALMRQAADLIEPTDYLFLHVELNLARAELAGLARRPEEEREALERALSAAGEKGCLVVERRIQERLAQL